MKYAAKALDQRHRVAIELYPLPENREQLDLVLNHVESMPHTPEERTALLTALAAHVGGTFPKKEALAAFQTGPLADYQEHADAGEPQPVEIQLDENNYGLVYSAVQYAAGSMGSVVPFASREADEKTGDTEHEESAATDVTERATDETAETPAEEETPAEGDAVVAETPPEATDPADPELAALESRMAELQQTLEALKARRTETPADSATEAVTPELSEAERQLQEAQETAHKALASSVALHMKVLHKPQARDKTQEALVEELLEKSSEVLQDRLEILMAEVAAGPLPAAGRIPTLTDPTLGDSGKTDSAKEDTVPDSAELVNEIEEEDSDEGVYHVPNGTAIDMLFSELAGDLVSDDLD